MDWLDRIEQSVEGVVPGTLVYDGGSGGDRYRIDSIKRLLPIVRAAEQLKDAYDQINAGLDSRDPNCCDHGYDMRDEAISNILKALDAAEQGAS